MDEWRPIVPEDDLRSTALSTRPTSRVRDWLRHGRDLIRWVGAGRMFTTVVTVPLVGVCVYLLVRPAPAPVETRIAYASTTPPTSATAPGAVEESMETVVVHVAGHVNAPGVYELAAGQRIVDAIRAAGGAQPIADLDTINLALHLADGDQIYVPAIGEVIPAPTVGRIGTTAGSEMSAFPVNINTATSSVLEELPGIGPSTAAAIIQHREKVGAFTSPSGLLDVPGIGQSKFEAIKDLVTT